MFTSLLKKFKFKKKIQVAQFIPPTLDIPESFLDPIDYEFLVDPVMTPYGQIYSRQTITGHLKNNNKLDPKTNQPISLQELDHVPKSIIQLIRLHADLQKNTMKNIEENHEQTKEYLGSYQN